MNVNLLRGSILKSLFLFAVPLFFSLLFQQLYNVVDTMIVGYYLGDASLAAVGSCTAVYNLLVGFALGIGNGLAIVTARSFGVGDREQLKKSVASALVIGTRCSILISVAGSLILKPLLRILNTPAEIMNEAYSYISLIMVFILVMFAYNLFAGLLRAVGDSFAPLVFLIISSGLNIGLDFLFIARLGWGVKGAAAATVLAQGVSSVLCFLYVVKKVKILIPKRNHFEADKNLYKEMLGQGLSMGFMGSIVSLGSVILQYGINGMGYLYIAAYTTGKKVFSFFYMPSAALGLAISTFVSQNRGANQRDRICKAMKIAYICNLIIAVILVGVIFLSSRGLIHFFSGSENPVVLDNGSLFLTITGPFYGILGILSQTRYALQGLGEKIRPLISSVIELIGKILFVWILIPKFQFMAVVLCEPVIWCVMTAQLVYAFWMNPYIKDIKQSLPS